MGLLVICVLMLGVFIGASITYLFCTTEYKKRRKELEDSFVSTIEKTKKYN